MISLAILDLAFFRRSRGEDPGGLIAATTSTLCNARARLSTIILDYFHFFWGWA
jgi:hypothetical protein